MTDVLTVGSGFAELGLAPTILGVLEKNKFVTPTPIQKQCIPIALTGKDVVGIAQTGTGKTLAFGLPMIQKLLADGGQGLVLLPTRELALQVDEVIQRIGRGLGLRTVVLIGGSSSRTQLQILHRAPHIVIATPGRLIDHLQQKNLNLDKVNTIILDEADRMFDIGFMPQIKEILKYAKTEHQTMLFSATMPPAVAELSARFMKMPLRIEVAPSGTPAAQIQQEIYIINQHGKLSLLEKILTDNQGSVLVFSRTKFGAKRIAAELRASNIRAAEIHSNRSLAQRREALDGFKSGRYRVLVATDIAARGIDVKNIAIVINFDLPDALEDYVHRIGRTGRAGMSGKAISFVTPGERYDIGKIERLIKKAIPILALPELPIRKDLPREVYSDRPPMTRSARPSYRSAQSHSPRVNNFSDQKKGFSKFSRGSVPSRERSYGRDSGTDKSLDQKPFRVANASFNKVTPIVKDGARPAFDKKKSFATDRFQRGRTQFPKRYGDFVSQNKEKVDVAENKEQSFSKKGYGVKYKKSWPAEAGGYKFPVTAKGRTYLKKKATGKFSASK